MTGGSSSASNVRRPPLVRRLAWLRVPLLRAAEYGAILLVVGEAFATLLLLVVIAYHHYDLVYRPRTLGSVAPPWLRRLAGGPLGRVTVVVVAAMFGYEQVAAGVLAAVLAALFGAESLMHVRANRDGISAGVGAHENAD